MPVAQKSAKYLAHRISLRMAGEMKEEEILSRYSMEYDYIPTTVFTPTEYSFVGLNEEEAVKKYGAEEVEVYHRQMRPLQFSLTYNSPKQAYMKLICLKSEGERVIGMHYLGPSADELIGGYALSMKLGLRKEHLDRSLGVHPSVGEDLHNLEVTKGSGKPYAKTSC
mmetsp:Transcript_5472/g.9267  ORF Transcript_5472/g.9267 Transcript_5472/m.9267 type:complete len:167 (+) Transcript_5472:1329-1829(+)